MIDKNEKGFALVLSLVLMLVMSLMGGALIVILLETIKVIIVVMSINKPFMWQKQLFLREKDVPNQSLGPRNISNHQRDMSRNLPNTLSFPTNMTQKNIIPNR